MGNTCYRNINAYYITLPPKNRFKTARDACVFMCYTIHVIHVGIRYITIINFLLHAILIYL